MTLHAQLDAPLGLGKGQLLGVGVGDDELDAFEPGLDHVVDRVAAGAADAEHDDPRLQFLGLRGAKTLNVMDPASLPWLLRVQRPARQACFDGWH